ncbi:MAG: hypothetical protein IJD38_03775, partial [Clostridia bacterium]|nr:hypothetical protein [Clostridia bacterium]
GSSCAGVKATYTTRLIERLEGRLAWETVDESDMGERTSGGNPGDLPRNNPGEQIAHAILEYSGKNHIKNTEPTPPRYGRLSK